MVSMDITPWTPGVVGRIPTEVGGIRYISIQENVWLPFTQYHIGRLRPRYTSTSMGCRVDCTQVFKSKRWSKTSLIWKGYMHQFRCYFKFISALSDLGNVPAQNNGNKHKCHSLIKYKIIPNFESLLWKSEFLVNIIYHWLSVCTTTQRPNTSGVYIKALLGWDHE